MFDITLQKKSKIPKNQRTLNIERCLLNRSKIIGSQEDNYNMRLYHRNDWDSIPWTDTDEGKWQRAYLEPILKNGTSDYIKNVQTKLYILHIDDLFIPLTVNEKEYENSRVCSIYSHFLAVEHEARRHLRWYFRILLSPLFAIGKLCFKVGKINQVVIVNNLLLSTILYDSMNPDQIKRICKYLKCQFSNHTIVFRSLNSYTEPHLMNALTDTGCRLVTSRSIYIFDPQNYPFLSYSKRKAIRRDKSLLKNKNIQIMHHQDFQNHDARQIKRLYDQLYLEKHSGANFFTQHFFEQAIKHKTFTLIGLKFENRIVGFTGFYKKKNIMTEPIIGYDTQLPKSLGLYRLLTAAAFEQSINENTLFHLSAGSGHFKRGRGAIQEIEYIAFQCDHLPLYRRWIMKTLSWLSTNIATPILKRHQ